MLTVRKWDVKPGFQAVETPLPFVRPWRSYGPNGHPGGGKKGAGEVWNRRRRGFQAAPADRAKRSAEARPIRTSEHRSGPDGASESGSSIRPLEPIPPVGRGAGDARRFDAAGTGTGGFRYPATKKVAGGW